MVKFSMKKKKISRNKTFLHVLFAVLNKFGIGFYMVIVTFTGEGSVWAQNID